MVSRQSEYLKLISSVDRVLPSNGTDAGGSCLPHSDWDLARELQETGEIFKDSWCAYRRTNSC